MSIDRADGGRSFGLAVTQGPIVLDGGLATELEAQGADLRDALWSARLLVEDPDAIVRAHLAFYRAGARVATTASYQASFAGFARRGIDAAAARDLFALSVRLADEARHRCADEVAAGATPPGATGGPAPAGATVARYVAASVGPYGATLADGSEYRGRYGLSTADLRAFHAPRMAVLAGAGADVLACETIPELEEGAALVGLFEELETSGWLSFTCADGERLAGGAPVEDAFALAESSPRVIAIGVNCTAPEHVDELLARARSVTDRPLVVYPNSGERWDPVAGQWQAVPAAPSSRVDGAAARRWVTAGARLVGGCCRVTPATIAGIAAVVDRPSPAAGGS
ncbi:MAG: homocysteine S-methyltransferase [Chloroflexi bacterium]|nr:homocysteine S-methyltransferase [Chloroflexota bacterium]